MSNTEGLVKFLIKIWEKDDNSMCIDTTRHEVKYAWMVCPIICGKPVDNNYGRHGRKFCVGDIRQSQEWR